MTGPKAAVSGKRAGSSSPEPRTTSGEAPPPSTGRCCGSCSLSPVSPPAIRSRTSTAETCTTRAPSPSLEEDGTDVIQGAALRRRPLRGRMSPVALLQLGRLAVVEPTALADELEQQLELVERVAL